MKLYCIEDSYIDFLKSYDKRIPDNKKQTRPYVGVVLDVNGFKYYAPLSSPKPKHLKMKNTKDFHKINAGKYGAINLNNMIPVVNEALIEIDIGNLSDVKYRRLLQNQFNYIKADKDKITHKACVLRTLMFEDDSNLTENDLKIKKRCCDLPTLEDHLKDYIPY